MTTEGPTAEVLVRMGIRRLLDHHPLLGGIISQWRIVEGNVETMGVSWEDNRITLAYGAAFVLAITMDQLENVLMHEVRHVIYGHCLMDPTEWPDQDALVIAQEVTVNEGLLDLPGDPLLLDDYPELKPDTDTRQRYAVLGDRKSHNTDGNNSALDIHDGAAPSLHQRCSSGESGRQLASMDDHGGWDSILQNRTQASVEIRIAIQHILAESPNLKRDVLELERAQSALSTCGSNPGEDVAIIGESKRLISTSQLRQLLLRLCGSGRDRGARFDRPPRRSPELIGIVPANSLMRNRVRALAVIDTSGPMEDETLASISAILRRIEDAANLTIVECDTAIHRVYPFTGRLSTVAGRGGTDFCPPLERVFLAKTRAEAVIYFTDGDGPAPDQPPHIPVIWALTYEGEPPVEWGMVLDVES